MHARLEANVIASRRQPVQLAPIPWGKRDRTLAKGICGHIEDATPSIVLRFNPFNHKRVRSFLQSHGITY